jgi:hypothetical protein
LVREGRLEMHQHAAFAPLFVRARGDAGQGGGVSSVGNG